MRVTIDTELCTGCGLCVKGCPDVFEMDGSVAAIKASSIPADAEKPCREAIDNCPMAAIAIADDGRLPSSDPGAPGR